MKCATDACTPEKCAPPHLAGLPRMRAAALPHLTDGQVLDMLSSVENCEAYRRTPSPGSGAVPAPAPMQVLLRLVYMIGMATRCWPVPIIPWST